jgi:Protein of unknown function (DUF1559)
VKLLACVGACLVVLAVLLTVEGALALVFGWVFFLVRMVPRMAPDWPSLAVGAAAVGLFAAGAHWAGRAWRRGRSPGDRTWKVRWSLASVAVLLLLFTAGVAVVGMVHQVAWLLGSDRPLLREGLTERDSSTNNLKMVGNAAVNYHHTFGRLPPGGSFTPDGAMRHSWETHLVLYLSYSTREIDMNRPWNDPVNQKYFRSVIPEFINPGFRTPPLEDADGYGLSHYAANSRVLAGNRSMRMDEIKDGASNTLLFGEVNAHFRPWGHPVNWRDPAAGINRSAHGFGGPEGAGGAHFVMADGSVRFVSDQISPAALRALSTPSGGEDVEAPGPEPR